ncbi:MAG: ABC transporter permease [Chloroflexota bacterium]|nr:ABC transporter permease [Chloroflexota bacterium]
MSNVAEALVRPPVGTPPSLPVAAPLRGRTWSRVRHNRLGVLGAAMILLAILVAVMAPVAAPYDPASQAFRRLLPPSGEHLMGTDELGRDTASRIIYGARVSLQVGVLAVVIGLGLGTCIGVLAGYYGGRLDDWLMRVVDIMSAFPGLILAIVIAGLLGPSRTNAMLAIGVVFAPPFARVVRGSVLAVMQEGYIEAARVMGLADARVILRYVLPNITAAIIVMTTVYLSTAILTEAGLSYLGLGTQPPEPSWGGMLSAARNYMELSPWMAFFPGAAVMLVVLGFNFLGDGLRDVLDPRLRNV